MKSYSSREIMKLLEKDGWYLVVVSGDHYQFKHPSKPGRVTLQHPVKDLSKSVLKSIERQSGLNFS